MNYSEVKELLDKGFTADEIRGMLVNNNPQNSQNNPQAEPQTEPEPQPEPQTELQTEPRTEPQTITDERFNSLNETMNRLIKTIQSANLQGATFETPTQKDINTEVDSIMSSIIRPNIEKEV